VQQNLHGPHLLDMRINWRSKFLLINSIFACCAVTADAQTTSIEKIEDFGGIILGHYYAGVGQLTICGRKFPAGKEFLSLFIRNNGGIANKVEARLFSELQRQKDAAYVLKVRNEVAGMRAETLSESSWPAHMIGHKGCQQTWQNVTSRVQDLDGKYRTEIYILLGPTGR
jgi:hypothetical protein